MKLFSEYDNTEPFAVTSFVCPMWKAKEPAYTDVILDFEIWQAGTLQMVKVFWKVMKIS